MGILQRYYPNEDDKWNGNMQNKHIGEFDLPALALYTQFKASMNCGSLNNVDYLCIIRYVCSRMYVRNLLTRTYEFETTDVIHAVRIKYSKTL